MRNLIIAPAIKEYCLDSTTHWNLASRRRAENQPRLVFFHPLRGLRIPRAFSPINIHLSVTTNADNSSIFNCLINNRVFSLLDPKSLEAALQEWISSLVSSLPPDIIAIDGKSLCGSNKPSAYSFVHMVSAFACSCGLSLAQIKVDEKTNEITAIPKLLDIIDIEGCTISIDAMGCQKDIAA